MTKKGRRKKVEQRTRLGRAREGMRKQHARTRGKQTAKRREQKRENRIKMKTKGAAVERFRNWISGLST